MRIGIYASPVDEGGDRRYFRSLIEALGRLGGGHEYVVYLERPLDPPLPQFPSLRLHVWPRGATGHWRHVHVDLARQLRQDHLDLFHAHFRCMPVDAPCPTVMSIHDAIHILSPQGTVDPAFRRSQYHEMRLALHSADRLIVPSEYTRRVLIDTLGVSARRMTTIPLGCSAVFRPLSRQQATQQVRRRFRLTRPYLLSLGPLLPRKNHPLLIRAFRRRLRQQYDLVIAGGKGWWPASARRVLRLMAGDRTMHYLGVVPDEELRQLYTAAECFVYPSEEEGFGLPPLEAMACGTPVVAMRCTSLPEIVGRAGLLVEPGSVTRLADALEGLLQNPRHQEALRRRGLARASRFRWEVTAAQTLAVYRRLTRAPGSRSGGGWRHGQSGQ